MLHDYEFYLDEDRYTPAVMMSSDVPLAQIVKGHRLHLSTQVHSTKIGYACQIREVVVLLSGGSGSVPMRVKSMVYLGPEDKIP